MRATRSNYHSKLPRSLSDLALAFGADDRRSTQELLEQRPVRLRRWLLVAVTVADPLRVEATDGLVEAPPAGCEVDRSRAVVGHAPNDGLKLLAPTRC